MLAAIKKRGNSKYLWLSSLFLLAMTGCAGADGSDGAAESSRGDSRSNQSALETSSADTGRSAFPACCALHWVDTGLHYDTQTLCGIWGSRDKGQAGIVDYECVQNPPDSRGRVTWELWFGYAE